MEVLGPHNHVKLRLGRLKLLRILLVGLLGEQAGEEALHGLKRVCVCVRVWIGREWP